MPGIRGGEGGEGGGAIKIQGIFVVIELFIIFAMMVVPLFTHWMRLHKLYTHADEQVQQRRYE